MTQYSRLSQATELIQVMFTHMPQYYPQLSKWLKMLICILSYRSQSKDSGLKYLILTSIFRTIKQMLHMMSTVDALAIIMELAEYLLSLDMQTVARLSPREMSMLR